MNTSHLIIGAGVASPFLAVAVTTATFFVLARGAERGGGRHAGAVVTAFLLAAPAALVALVAFAGWLLRCDEVCDDALLPTYRRGHWWNSAGAWQWDLQMLLALCGLMLVVLALVLVLRRRYRRGSAAMALGWASLAAWAAIIWPLG